METAGAAPPRVLFLTTLLPSGRRTGSEVATAAFVDGLRAAGCEVLVLGYRRAEDRLDTNDFEVEVAERRIETRPLTGRRRGADLHAAVWMLDALARRHPYSLAKYRSKRYVRAQEQAMAGMDPDLVVLDHAQIAWAIPRAGFGRPWIYLAHNVEHQVHAAAAARHRGLRAWLHRREAARIEPVERALLSSASQTWTLTREDADELELLVPGSDPRQIAVPPRPISETGGAKTFDIGLLGTWTWEPNAVGLRWFLSDVCGQLPDSIRIAVAGAGAEHLGADSGPGLEHVGVVPDAGRFLQSARVIAIPALAGGGIQIKTLDAIASGVPVVATSVALRGIDDPPATVRVADGTTAFAGALQEVLANVSTGKAEAVGRAWAVQRQRRFERDLADSLAELRSGRGP